MRAQALAGCPLESLDASADEVAVFDFDRSSQLVTEAAVGVWGPPDWLAQGGLLSADCAGDIYTSPHKVEFNAAGFSAILIMTYHPRDGCPRWDDVPDEFKTAILRRILSDAAPVVGWPGRLVASHRPVRGERAEALEAPVAVMVDLRLRGCPTAVSAEVRFAQARSQGGWGSVLVFDVVIVATSSSAGGCPRAASEARGTGELVVSAYDGKFIALHVKGPYEDFQTVCAAEAPDAGPHAASNLCAAGVLSVDVTWGYCFGPA